MKKLFALPIILAVLIGLSACSAGYDSRDAKFAEQASEDSVSQEQYGDEDGLLVYTDGDKLTCPNGDTYVFLASEEEGVYTSKKLGLFAVVAGEDEMGVYDLFRCGLYEVPNDAERNVVLRIVPDNEWYAVYVKEGYDAAEPVLENITRLVYTEEDPYFDTEVNSIAYSTDGLTGEDAQSILNEVQKAQSPEEAGINDYTYVGYILGFFDDEQAYYALYQVSAHKGKGFSLQLDNGEYMLTKEQARSMGIIR